jgi:hypothetical protein
LHVAVGGKQAIAERDPAGFDAIGKMPGDGLVVLENMTVTVDNLQLIFHRNPPMRPVPVGLNRSPEQSLKKKNN